LSAERSTSQREAGEIEAGRYDALIVVRIDANVVQLQVKRVGAKRQMFEFVFVQVGPAPQTSVYDVRETFATGDL
jgi:hypothetical protein